MLFIYGFAIAGGILALLVSVYIVALNYYLRRDLRETGSLLQSASV
jgi:hypothetical protein